MLALVACGGPGAKRELAVGIATSVQDSGLLDPLVAAFERSGTYRLRTTVQGTGALLDLARRGDVDVVLVHEPQQEEQLMAAGRGARRELVMSNDFVLVGPPADPARVRSRAIDDAFREIARAQAPFVSRGDRSGTDVAEKAIWKRVGIAPAAPWYLESGTGQGQSLVVASERRAYMLVDRATFAGRKATLQLDLLVAPQPALPNVYHAIVVKGAKDPAGSGAFVDFLTGPEGQRVIAASGLFSPR